MPPPRRRRLASRPSPADARLGEEDRAFLETYDESAYARPSVAVDVVVLGPRAGALQALLVRRHEPPFRDRYALPGGFCRIDESLDDAARRVLSSKAGLGGVFLEQLYTFGAPDRDPRTRVITVAYYALVAEERLAALSAGPLGPSGVLAEVHVPWEGEVGGPVELLGADGAPLDLAFDHGAIVGLAIKRIRGKLDYAPIGFQLLPEQFTLRQLQDVHEMILGRPLNKDSFRRRMLATCQLDPTGRLQRDVDHRPAELYRFRNRSAV